MKDDYISATDINKFVYCNFSYYYEKKYGAKELRRLKKEYNEEHGYTNSNDNFTKGREFHNNYYNKNRLKVILVALMFLIFSCFVFYFLVIWS